MKPSIEVNSYISFQKINKKLPMMNANQYLEKVQQGIPGAMDGGAKVDWMDEILQTPFNQTYSINLREDRQIPAISPVSIIPRMREL